MKVKYISLQLVVVMVFCLAVIESGHRKNRRKNRRLELTTQTTETDESELDGRKTAECVFPFKYKNDWYHGCTTKDAGRAWCSKQQSTEFNLHGGEYWAWGWCYDISFIETFSESESIGQSKTSIRRMRVTFGEELPSVPFVEAWTEGSSLYSDTFTTMISDISNAGFIVAVKRTDRDLGWDQNPILHWTVKDSGTATQTKDDMVSFEIQRETKLRGRTTDNGWMRMTPKKCAKKCKKQGESRCVSFNFIRPIDGCDLFSYTKDSSEISPSTITNRDVDYYELHDLEDYMLYFKRIEGRKLRDIHVELGWKHITPDGCARKCKKEKTFECKSFNYNKNTEECNLFSTNTHTLPISPATAPDWIFDYYEIPTLVIQTYTYTGKECHFPFKYKGDTFYGCTTLDHPRHKSWCFIKNEATNTQSKYQDLCANDHNQVVRTFGRESDGSQCHFPFTYKGVTYHGCTNDNRPGLYDRQSDGRYWCGLTPIVHDRRNTKWGYCNVIDTVQHVYSLVWNTYKAWKPTTCVFPFKYKGSQFYGCQSYKDSKRTLWCSTTDNYDRDEMWKYCDDADVIAVAGYIRPQNECSREKPQCSFPYVRKDMLQIGDWFYSTPECSTTYNYDRDERSQISGRAPYAPHREDQCHYPFLYKGTIYYSCVHGLTYYWCSRDRVHNEDWITCDPEQIPTHQADTIAMFQG